MSTERASADAGTSRAPFTKPFRWELRPGDPLAGAVASAGEADTEAEARDALARALVSAHALDTWLEATGSVHAMAPDGSVRELERLRWTRTAVPVGAALALIVGRRVERPEHAPLVAALRDHVTRRHCPPEQRHAPSVVQTGARALFPTLAHETDAELAAAPDADADAREQAARAWLEAREAQYGPTVPLRLHAGD
jgi:hypothetical protein